MYVSVPEFQRQLKEVDARLEQERKMEMNKPRKVKAPKPRGYWFVNVLYVLALISVTVGASKLEESFHQLTPLLYLMVIKAWFIVTGIWLVLLAIVYAIDDDYQAWREAKREAKRQQARKKFGLN